MNQPLVFMCSHPEPTSYMILPLRVIQCTSPEHPVSCIEPGLFHICILKPHVSMLFSQSSNLRLLPQSPKDCFYICASFAVWQIGSPLPFAKFRSYALIYCICGEGNGTPLQYFSLENPMDRVAWWAAVHGVMKSRTWLSDFTFTFHFHFSLSCIGEGNGNPLQCSFFFFFFFILFLNFT